MIKVKIPLTAAAILAISIVTLSGCGGGSGSAAGGASSGETINGILVPPLPDLTANNATLAGVDSNRNGVRDDVERDIAQAVKTQSSFDKSIVVAKEISRLATAISEIPNEELDIIFKNVMCQDYAVYKESGFTIEEELREQIFDNDARKAAYERATASYGGAEGDVNECI